MRHRARFFKIGSSIQSSQNLSNVTMFKNCVYARKKTIAQCELCNMFQSWDIESMLRKLILDKHVHSSKSLKRNNIHKLCLWITEELSCLILHVHPTAAVLLTKSGQRGARKYRLLLHSAESFMLSNI